MEFDPNNVVVQLCIQGIAMEEKGQPEEAGKLFLKAWNEAGDEFGKFIAAYHFARLQDNVSDQLKWFQTGLEIALRINNGAVNSALFTLYSNIARCYGKLGDSDNLKKHEELANSYKDKVSDHGPFFHGTRADLQVGDFLTAGRISNYKDDLPMNHIYFTALINGAGLAAALAKGDGSQRVYIVEPTGAFENDPNVTDKKFPGNLTRSFRTQSPLKIIGEVPHWEKQTPATIQKWKERLAENKGEIIN